MVKPTTTITDTDLEKLRKESLQQITPLPTQQESVGLMGWVCPVCGRGLSPFVMVCPCKSEAYSWRITC